MIKKIFSLLLLFLMVGGYSHAIVSGTTYKNVIACDGSTSTFTYTFPIIDQATASDLQVYTVSSAGVQTLLTTNYSVNTQTSTVTYPIVGSPCALTNTIVLLRSEPLTQNQAASYQGSGVTPPVMSMSDKLTMISQQLQGQLNQTLQLPVSITTPIQFPAPVANGFIAYDSTGTYLTTTAGAVGPQGPAGPPGAGSGNVNGPGTNTANFIPQWNGTNSLTLKNGVGIGTTANSLIQVAVTGQYPAMSGVNITGVNASTLGGVGIGTYAGQVVSVGGGGDLPAFKGATLTAVNAVQLLGQVPGSSANNLVELDGSAKLPAVDGSQLTNLPGANNWVPNNIQVFTTTGTWTKPSNVSKVYVKVVGAGGNGGAAATSNKGGGGGGGGGGYAEGIITVTGNVTVTIGATNSFAGAITIQSTSGSNGGAGSSTIGGAGGAGGTGSNGTINLTGSPGTNGTYGTGGMYGSGGNGGTSVIGGGGLGADSSGACGTGNVGGNGLAYGGGGGGGSDCTAVGGTGNGGAVIVYY